MSNKEVSLNEVQKIAKLSKLRLEGQELENMAKDFNQIIQFIKQIETVDTSNVKPMEHVLEHTNVRRDDIAQQSLPPETVKNMAPSYEAGFFIVPKVIETEN
ncbi:MAG: Asp-tRNA(Asn)/Glu-tRNA(Gln) amidotransferase subunit GatC [Spirochaetia bacterium]|nr:Asp-tRNA(Asn)/Glu-tRNA(Gln) amidotransferase subunit GatC [Spirochaetia bacterium]